MIWNHETGRRAAKSRKAWRKHKPDREATAKRLFLDKGSFVDVNGHLFLKGHDMAVQHDAVMFRDDFRCQDCCHGLIGWNQYGIEVHQVVPRGKGGSDDLENLVVLCKKCHMVRHPQVQLRAVSA